MNGNNVRIEQEDYRSAKVFIDGKELKGVQHINYRVGMDEMPIVTVEFIPETLNIDEENEQTKINKAIKKLLEEKGVTL